MKKTFFKKLLLSVASIKVVLGLGAYVATTNVVHAETSGSPLLSQRQANPVVDRLAADIRTATQDMRVGSPEYYSAMARVIDGANGIDIGTLASLFNTLEMPANQSSNFAGRFVEDNDLGNIWDFHRALLEDKLANNGQRAAQNLYNAFANDYGRVGEPAALEQYKSDVAGIDLYNRIWGTRRVSNVQELANIETGAGGDDGDTGGSVYNG